MLISNNGQIELTLEQSLSNVQFSDDSTEFVTTSWHHQTNVWAMNETRDWQLVHENLKVGSQPLLGLGGRIAWDQGQADKDSVNVWDPKTLETRILSCDGFAYSPYWLTTGPSLLVNCPSADGSRTSDVLTEVERSQFFLASPKSK